MQPCGEATELHARELNHMKSLLRRCLCARLSPTLIAPEHLQGLLEVAGKEAGEKQEGGYPSAVLDLLLGCAASAPALFAGTSEQVSKQWMCGRHVICNELHDVT